MSWRTGAAVAWTLLILALCSVPGSDLPGPEMVGADKIAHFALFAAFGWLWIGVPAVRGGPGVWGVLLAGLFLAVFTEWSQDLLPIDRDASALDALANTAGLIAGIGVDRWTEHNWKRRESSQP